MLSKESNLLQYIAITALTVKEVSFENTIPNVVQIRNNSAYNIYVSESALVNTSNYMKLIPSLTTKKYTSMVGFSKLFLYSTGNITDLQITSGSLEKSLTISDLDEDMSLNSSVTIGSLSALPAGTNTIGSVKITDGTDVALVDASGNLNVTFGGSLPAGSNNIGDVDVLSLPALPAGSNNIGDVDVLSLPALPAGSNNIGDVDIISMPAIPTGTNNIGSIKIKDTGGTNELKVEADGSINANVSATLTATNVQIDDGTDTMAVNADGSINIGPIPAGSNNIGDVDVLSLPALAAGSNNIGDVDVLTIASGQNIKPATTLNIHNVTCTTAGTEYSQALTANTKKFTIGLKSRNSSVTWILKDGASGTEFSLSGNESISEDNLLLSGLTLYFETNLDGEIIQIMDWS